MIALLLVVGLFAAPQAHASNREADKAKDRMNDAKDKIGDLDKDIRKRDRKEAAQSREVSDLKAAIGQIFKTPYSDYIRSILTEEHYTCESLAPKMTDDDDDDNDEDCARGKYCVAKEFYDRVRGHCRGHTFDTSLCTDQEDPRGVVLRRIAKLADFNERKCKKALSELYDLQQGRRSHAQETEQIRDQRRQQVDELNDAADDYVRAKTQRNPR